MGGEAPARAGPPPPPGTGECGRRVEAARQHSHADFYAWTRWQGRASRAAARAGVCHGCARAAGAWECVFRAACRVVAENIGGVP